MQPTPTNDPITLAETLEQELNRLGTAVQHINAAQQAATQATEAAAQVVQNVQVLAQQQELTLGEVAQQLAQLTQQLEMLQPQLKSMEKSFLQQPSAAVSQANNPPLSTWVKAGFLLAAGTFVLQLSLHSRSTGK